MPRWWIRFHERLRGDRPVRTQLESSNPWNMLGWGLAILVLLFVFGLASCRVLLTPVEEGARPEVVIS